jgi:hypothetical protein
VTAGHAVILQVKEKCTKGKEYSCTKSILISKSILLKYRHKTLK